MVRDSQALDASLAARAAKLRARRVVNEVDTFRFLKDALQGEGAEVAHVASALGISRSSVSGLMAKLRDAPEVIKPSVGEVVSRALLGQIDRTEMVDQLRALQLMYVQPRSHPESEWANLRAAVRAGLLSEGEASSVVAATAERMVARVRHSMDLEAKPVTDESVEAVLGETIESLSGSLMEDLGDAALPSQGGRTLEGPHRGPSGEPLH